MIYLSLLGKIQSFVKAYINCVTVRYICLRLSEFESNQRNL